MTTSKLIFMIKRTQATQMEMKSFDQKVPSVRQVNVNKDEKNSHSGGLKTKSTTTTTATTKKIHWSLIIPSLVTNEHKHIVLQSAVTMSQNDNKTAREKKNKTQSERET